LAAEDSERLEFLNRLAEEYTLRCRRGERPSLQEYIDKHPDLAPDIRKRFPAAVGQVTVERQAVSQSDAASSLPFERLGDFRIIREIGHGGMGIVYEAEQVSLGRHVALKVLPRQLVINKRTKRRFEREAKAAAKLHHTNIVPVFGVGEHEGLPYYVMQYIQGTGLDVVIHELMRMGPSFGALTTSPLPGASLSRRDASVIAQSLVSGVHQSSTSASQPSPAAGEGREEEEPKDATVEW